MSGSVEQRGIDLVPPSGRYGRPRDLFFLWAGTTTNIYTVSYGAMLVLLFGLSFGQALTAIVIGNILAYPLLAMTSLQGPTTGTTTMTISRASLGPNGARVNGVFSWLMLLGFEAGGLILVFYAATSLLDLAGVEVTGAQQVVLIVALGLVQMMLPFFGHRLLMFIQKYATGVFAVSFVVLAALIIPQIEPGSVSTPFDPATMISAIGLVVVSGGLSWAPSGANFSRYLPVVSPRPAVALWAGLGGFLPYLLLQSLGAGMATVAVSPDVDLTNPLAVPAVLPGLFAVPFLILVMVGLMVQNSTNLYSSGLNLQTAGIHAPRWLIVVTDSALCILIAIFAVTQASFYELLQVFVASLSIWLAPWVTIHLIDWALRRGRYDLPGLAGERGGPYWGAGGIRIPGILALAGGMLVSVLFINSGYFVGPLTAMFSAEMPEFAPDLSIVAGMIAAGLLYLLLGLLSGQPTRDAVTPAAHSADETPDTTTDHEEFTRA